MKIIRKLNNNLEAIKKMELCPSLLNLYSQRYSFGFLFNDLLSGLKIFLLLFPIAFSLAFFCGVSPVQGIISCAVAAAISAILGGSKYQVSTVALPLCVITFEIMTNYQYKGLLFVSIFASIALILFGLLRMSEVLRHLSYAFISAISIYVILYIIVSQAQYILGISSAHSSQGLLDNIELFKANISKLTYQGALTAAAFIAPLFIIRSFCKNYYAFLIYLILGVAAAYVFEIGLLPNFIDINTIGKEFVSNQNIANIFTISKDIPSQTFLSNTMNYSFAIALIIAAEASFCTNVSGSITGDKKLQTNMELMSSGISNFLSVACGGLFVSPSVALSLKNISFKTKTIISALIVASLAYSFVLFSNIALKYIPIYCISSILIVFAIFEFSNKKVLQYFNPKNSESYIFLLTLFVAVFFGFIPAVIVGFVLSNIFFSKRMIKIKDANMYTTKNHDVDTIEFMSNKNGYSTGQNIPQYILDKIEVIQISDMLFLNIAKLVEEALLSRGKFPSVLVIYFRNVPYLDSEALISLHQLVRFAAKRGCIAMISGTNGRLLDIVQKANDMNKEGSFGYIVPDFKDAIAKTVKRLAINKNL